jgi:hypothetical protein
MPARDFYIAHKGDCPYSPLKHTKYISLPLNTCSASQSIILNRKPFDISDVYEPRNYTFGTHLISDGTAVLFMIDVNG